MSDSQSEMVNENFIAEPPAKGLATEAMGLVNSGHLVKRIYEGASPFAFLREFIQNSAEAGATRVEIGPDWVGLKAYQDMGMPATYKLCISDNGDGIPRNKIKGLLNNLSSSGRNMDTHGNFGVGAKVAALPWNPYGITFMSWTKNDGDSMVRVYRRTDGNYGLFRFNQGDDFGDDFSDLVDPPKDYRQTFQKESGTTVVLLGKDLEEDTVFGPPDQEAGLYALLNIVNDRYFKFPENVEVWMTLFETTNKKNWPKNKSDSKRLRAYGSFYYLDKYSDDCGTVKIDGAKVHWWWHKDWTTGNKGHEKGTNQLHSPLGYIGTMYNNELYDTHRKVKYSRSNGTSNFSLLSMYAKFGILWQDVFKNVTLVVEPDQYSAECPNGVMPDLARGHLKMANGEDLPWDEWGQKFAEKMPEVILKAIEEEAGESSEVVDYEAKLKEYLGRMDLYGDEPSQRATHGTYPRRRASKNSGTNSHGTPNGSAEGERKVTKYNLPEISWVNPEVMEELFEGKGVFYNESSNSLMFNNKFPLWKVMEQHWVAKYPKGIPGLSARVKEAVKYVYASSVITKLVHLRKFRGHKDWPTKAIREAQSPAALTMAVLGIQDADTRIAAYLKGSVKTKREDQ